MDLKYIVDKFLDEKSILDYGTQKNDLEFKKSFWLRLQRLWEIAASCLFSYIVYIFFNSHIRAHFRLYRHFASAATAFLMFFCKRKNTEKDIYLCKNIIFFINSMTDGNCGLF